MPNRTDLMGKVPPGTELGPRSVAGPAGADGATGATGPAGGTVLHGALLKITADQTLASGNQQPAWDAAVYDTDSCWSAGNASKLIVPPAFHYARIIGGFLFTSAASVQAFYYFHKGALPLIPFSIFEPASGVSQVANYLAGPWMPVSEGDDFELNINTAAGCTLDGTTTPQANYFGIELAV